MRLPRIHSEHTTRRSIRSGFFRLFVPALFLLSIFWMGCEEKVTAVLGTERPFTLFGVLNPMADTQWVRVFPIEGTLEAARAEPLSASFTSRSQSLADLRAWTDSLIQEENGQYAHVYWAPFTALFGDTYVLQVRNQEGAITEVTTTVPPFSSLRLPPTERTPPSILPVLIEGAVPNLIRIEVVYTFKFATLKGVERLTAFFSYDGKQEKTLNGWEIDLNISADRRVILQELKERLSIDEQIGVKIVAVNIKMIAANAEWNPPGGVFDPEILVQPGTLSNVKNGFGFVGAGYRLEGTWVPLDTLITSTS